MEHPYPTKNLQGIIYSEYTALNRSGEHFMQDHFFAYMICGELTVAVDDTTLSFGPGDYMYCPKNQLAKFVKRPAADGSFKSINIILDQDTLRQLHNEQVAGVTATRVNKGIMKLAHNVLLENYFHSLLPYFNRDMPDALVALKKKEALLLLLQAQPELAGQLFDFSQPGKIDLEAFMNQHYRYNVDIKRFAYLTGRSLATFKRDFEKTFHISPSRWLQQKRLQEAYQLIKEKGEKPSDVYLDVGFETLSHFSYSFKQFFGVNPSSV